MASVTVCLLRRNGGTSSLNGALWIVRTRSQCRLARICQFWRWGPAHTLFFGLSKIGQELSEPFALPHRAEVWIGCQVFTRWETAVLAACPQPVSALCLVSEERRDTRQIVRGGTG